ncbi:MAG TPA: N-acetyltransferase [Thermoanaerobaculia bacterium]|nr:N-acetyltransferase [Thermoanaerobaculia bacterium]
MTIRTETSADAAAIHEVNQLAFGQPDEAVLVDRLREQGAAEVSLVAEAEGEIVGHILFSPVVVHDPAFTGSAVGLAPMAVRPGWQRRGIGGALIREGLRRCAEAGHGAVVVLGHAEYYPRFGFRPAHEWGLRCEYPVPPEVFQAQELRPGAFTGAPALVTYHPAFAAL